MSKHSNRMAQPSLLPPEKQSPPPDYFYSGDRPNPHLQPFTTQQCKPWVLSEDKYDVPAFAEQIISTKSSSTYGLHMYWTKKPHGAIQQYIAHYTEPGDVVLDPMCGSGGTALMALLNGRKAIAIDRSPAATFITKNCCTPFSITDVQRAYSTAMATVNKEIRWLYETRCDRCGGSATTSHTVYSQVFRCTRCMQPVAFFDCVEAEQPQRSGKVKSVAACPFCYAKGRIEEISTSGEKLGSMPVQVNYICNGRCSPKRADRTHNDADAKRRRFFHEHDFRKIQEIEATEIPYEYPHTRMMHAPEGQTKWGTLYRQGVACWAYIDEVFTKRNLWALAALRNAIDLCSPLGFIFSSIILNASRMYRHREGGGGGPAGNISLPQIGREMNVLSLFDSKYGDVLNAAPELSRLRPEHACVSTQSATDLNEIPDNTMDYIFTDPPYSHKFPYGELNFIWEEWLRLDSRWHEDEIIINDVFGKTEADWAEGMRKVFCECYRVLKPGRWMSLCYHDTSEGTWALVQDLMAEAGFVVENTEAALYIDTNQKTIKQLLADKVNRRDLVINFRKPRAGEWRITQLFIPADVDVPTFNDIARQIIREFLTQHPGSGKDRVYDCLVSRTVRKGQMEAHNFDELLLSMAEQIEGRWYLRETADLVDQAEQGKEDAAAGRLEKFMLKHLKEHPENEGAHYSDLFEEYLPVQDKPRRLLADWIPEYFIKTPSGTWRPPNDDERKLLAELREAGTLRRIKRFANALIDGVPVRDKDRPANDRDLLDWLRQCRRAGLYEQGKAIYEKGGLNLANLSDEDQLEAEDEYRTCARRGSDEEAKPKRKRRKT